MSVLVKFKPAVMIMWANLFSRESLNASGADHSKSAYYLDNESILFKVAQIIVQYGLNNVYRFSEGMEHGSRTE